MKRNNVLIITGFCASLLLTMYGCKKDSNNSPSNTTPPATTASMTALVDGVAWTSLSNRAAGSIVNNTSNLTGVASDSTVITMTVTENVTLNGTYDLGPASGNAGVFSPSTAGTAPAWSSNAHPLSNGLLTITSMDTVNKKMGGTFSYKAWRATDNTFKEITQGVFTNVPYITSLSGGGNNTFTIKIDNVTFTPALITGTANNGTLNIIATDSQGIKSVGLGMPDNVSPGTYSMTPFGTYYGQYNASASVFTMSASGSLVITSHNTTTNVISGTCAFVSEPLTGGPPTYNLTNGSFTINY